MTASVFIERMGTIAHLVLNRPEKRNALNMDMWRRLDACLDDLSADRETRVVILRGVDQTAFAAGADISEFERIYATRASTEDYRGVLRSAQRKLAALNKPVIARIQGPCVGAGCGLALCCDVRIAAPSAGLGITPAKLGVVYGLWETKRLVDIVGPSQAKHMLFSAQILDAREALRIGLIDQLCDDEAIAAATDQYAELLASNSLYTIQAAKRFVELIRDGQSDDTAEIRDLSVGGFFGEDFIEGRTAFMEKRKPKFPYKG